MTSFSSRVKESLARLPMENSCCQLAELAACLHVKGSIEITGGRLALTVVSENPVVIRRVFSLLKSTFSLNSEIFFRKKTKLRKNHIFLLQIRGEEEVRLILRFLGRKEKDKQWVKGPPPALIKEQCCKKAYLRGAFLAGGYISSPSSGYHLEITADYEEHIKTLLTLLKDFGLTGKASERKTSWVLYLKGSEAIADFLRIIGAYEALFSFENVRVVKEMRNLVNRLINFETANLDKTIEAALKQINDIKLIQKYLGSQKIPANIKPLAALRLAYPEATLEELGAMLDPPLSKSGVNHRFRKLREMAAKFRP